MPQLDLDNQDHLACVGARGHGEYKCDKAGAGAVQRGGDVSATARANDGDAPPESVLLRVPDGIGLAELLCAALRRAGSTKGSSNPKAAAEEAAAVRKQGAPRAESRRSTATKNAVVIGVLPAAAGKVVGKERRAAVARAWRRPAAGARVFASEAVGPEPVSPKVSCFGAVLPETRGAAAATGRPPSVEPEEQEERGGGCWASAAATLRGLCCSCDSEPGASESDSKAKAAAPEPPPAATVLSPPRLGDVKRLASRRWTEAMAAERRGSV
ncbi:unnamed protein product [Urochloa humidicola]